MKAAVYHGTADVRVEDVVRPTIGAGEILVKVKACAIYKQVLASPGLTQSEKLKAQSKVRNCARISI